MTILHCVRVQSDFSIYMCMLGLDLVTVMAACEFTMLSKIYNLNFQSSFLRKVKMKLIFQYF